MLDPATMLVSTLDLASCIPAKDSAVNQAARQIGWFRLRSGTTTFNAPGRPRSEQAAARGSPSCHRGVRATARRSGARATAPAARGSPSLCPGLPASRPPGASAVQVGRPPRPDRHRGDRHRAPRRASAQSRRRWSARRGPRESALFPRSSASPVTMRTFCMRYRNSDASAATR